MATKKRLTLEDLNRLTLKSGGHARRGIDSLCVMEAVAWFAGRDHTDRPPCVSPVIGDFLRSWNDAMNDEDRQMLKPLIPLVVGTAADAETEMRRSVMALDWLCRVSAPAWLRLAGLTTEAEAIEGTAPITSPENARAAQAALTRATSAAYRKWSATYDAAYGAAYGAARVAAYGAAHGAAYGAARDAAYGAAYGAARVAAYGAAYGAAHGAALDAAYGAAYGALRPTVVRLQASAIDLVTAMATLSTSETTEGARRSGTRAGGATR
jgi:hypothetical protein